MLKTLNIKDPHFRAETFKAPIGREQDFHNDIKNKIDQIVEIIKKEKIDLVTTAGDIFDIKQPSRYDLEAIDSLYNILDRIKQATKKKLILTIAGNHDLPSSSKALKYKSLYSHFCKVGLLTDVNEPIVVSDGPKGRVTIKFKGFDYENKISILKRKIIKYNKINTMSTHNVLMLHEHALPKGAEASQEVKYLGSTLTYEYLSKFKNIDMFILGHYHKGFDTQKLNNTTIINNWNLTRLARNYYVLNSEHIPNVTISTFTRTDIITKDIPLKVRDYLITNIEITDDENEELVNIDELVKNINNLEDITSNKKIRLNRSQKSLLKDILKQAQEQIQT